MGDGSRFILSVSTNIGKIFMAIRSEMNADILLYYPRHFFSLRRLSGVIVGSG